MPEKKNILIIDDEAAQCNAMRDKLAKEGFGISIAGNGIEGLEIAFKEHPDLIVLDLMMPEMDGLETAKQLREDEWGKGVPVLILTNTGSMDTVQQALENGVFEYLLKSDTKLEDLATRVKKMLKMKE